MQSIMYLASKGDFVGYEIGNLYEGSGRECSEGGIHMITEADFIWGVAKIFDALISKAVSDGVDISKNEIKNAYLHRRSDSQNLLTQLYHVIVDSLNKFTSNKYENGDELFDAAESILKGFINGKCGTDAIKSGLKMLDSNVKNDNCKDFLECLYHEICKDRNNDLYKEIGLFWTEQLSELIHNGVEENKQAHNETHRKCKKIY